MRIYGIKFVKKEVTLIEYVPIRKMCVSYLILTLVRWCEFYEHYHDLIPSHLLTASHDLTKLIERKRLRHFRNKCIGHIWDNTSNRPLFLSQIETEVGAITDNDLDSFLNWIIPLKRNLPPDCVQQIVFSLQEALVERYGIASGEVMGR